MAVNPLLAMLFHIGWGMYLIGETARLGGDSREPCDNKKDSDAAEALCNGYGAGAAFAMFAALSAFVAAALSKRGSISWYPFLGSLALYSLSKLSETGGLSQANCDKKGFDNQEHCDGYTAAAIFYFIAFAAALSVMALIWKMGELKFFSISAFFGFLAVFALAHVAEWGGTTDSTCKSKNDDDIVEAGCSGGGFATFVITMAMIAAAAYAGLTYTQKNLGSNLWLGGSIFFAIYFLAVTSNVGTAANIYCDLIDDPSDGDKRRCDGFAAATFFTLMATIAAGVAAFFAYRGQDSLKQAAFLAAFALFYMGYVCTTGGESAANCEEYREYKDKKMKGDFVDEAETQCGSQGGAAFFGFVAFALLAAAAVLTHLPQGAPTAEEGAESADPSAPQQQEKDVPVVTAVAVAEEDGQDKNGANV